MAQATFAWDANTEPDLSGYKFYWGTGSQNYNAPGSPVSVGNVLTYTVTGLLDLTTYYFAVKAVNTSSQESVFSNEVSYTTPAAPDTTAPIISNGSPSGTLPLGTTQATLSVTTNENATVRYSTTAGTAYASMTNTFTTTGGTSHNRLVTGLSNGQTYNFYVRSIDVAGNPNTSDYVITFSVAAPDVTPPAAPTGVTIR